MIETYLSTEFQLDTRPRVSAKLNVIEVTENEFELKVVLSEFDPKKKRYDIHVEVECQNEKNDIIYSKNSNSFESLHFVFDNLDPNTIYNCKGNLVFDRVESDIAHVNVQTLDGVPDKPENVTLLFAEPKKIEISWQTPTVSRGIVQEYQIDVFPKFDKVKKADNFCSNEPRHEKEFRLISDGGQVTRAWLQHLTPATTYDVTVRAKTRHQNVGHPADVMTVSTPSGRPHQPVINKSYQSKGGDLIIDFTYPCPMTGETTFRASWSCVAPSTNGISCPSVANVTQSFITPKTIQLSGLPGGHFYYLKVAATVANCFEGNCESESDLHSAFVTCDYRCKDKTCLHNPSAR